MDDARRLLELLRPAVERAEQIEQQQQAIADQIAKLKEAAEAEREGMITERANVTALREAAVTQAREEADAIIASARAEEETARARIAELLQAQAHREAAHAATMAAAEAERAELDAQREELIAFETACAEKQERLQALCRKEGEIFSARAREMQELEGQAAIEGAVTDAQNRKLGQQQNLTRYEKGCSSSGRYTAEDKAREAETREYFKSHLAVAEAHLLELQELCKPLQACRPLHTQGGVDTHCLAEEESCAGDKGGRNHNAHEELQQALQQSVRFITLTLPVAESRTLQLQKEMRDLDATCTRLSKAYQPYDHYSEKIKWTNGIWNEELKHLQLLQQLARPLQARLHI
jgi:hypothetical protein